MSTTCHYRATCGSLYRVTTKPASRSSTASTIQARRSIYATEFSPEYPTTTAEVSRLVSFGTFTEVPCSSSQKTENATSQAKKQA